MNIKKIVWLEDRWDSMTHHLELVQNLAFKKNISLIEVSNPDDVTKFCKEYLDSKQPDYFLILDLLIIGKEQLVIPKEYYHPPTLADVWYPTFGTGHDAGLLLYEKLFIHASPTNETNENNFSTPKLIPPPVAFLTVSDLDYARHGERLKVIRDVTKNKLKNVDVAIYQSWMSKFSFDAKKLEAFLEAL
ncbi:MAG: hypothetical protein U1C33_06150 [Candidatus Cloacimonadaceae bacterium]|nr:hypothetical protein [Candidatus Cloacimonadaceae bacterium]